MAKLSGLGKGLDAIFIENDAENNSAVKLRISEIEPNKNQPRHDFDEKALSELADSISQHGILQPLLVRPLACGNYQIVAGERRWRASRMAGLTEVPVIIKKLTDLEVMQIALIENLQREDLSPIEEAEGYQSLINTYDYTQEQVAKIVGKSRSVVTNSLRILLLPKKVIDMIEKGDLTAGHARTLLSLKDESEIEKVANTVVEKMLSVRELEKLCKNINEKKVSKKKEATVRRNPFFDEVEIALKENLGRKVHVTKSNKNRGILQIEFYNDEDLAHIARLLGESDI